MAHPDTDIIWLRDKQGVFPFAQFSGDTDALTMGWESFTAKSGDEVILAELNEIESRFGDEGIAMLLSRVQAALGRDDLFRPQVRYERDGKSAKGMAFSEFRRVSRPMRAHYSARDGVGKAKRVRQESLADFVANGGRLTVVSPNTSLERTREE